MTTIKKADVAVLSQAIKTVSKLDKSEVDNFLADLFGERPEDTEDHRNSTERHKLIELLIGIEDGTEEISKADHKKVFEPFTREQKYAYKYTAKNWKIALKLRKDNGYWRKDKNGNRQKVKFNPTTIESVRTEIRRATATPAVKTPLTQEKLVELIVDTCASEEFDLLEVVQQAKDLFDSRQPQEKQEPSLPPMEHDLGELQDVA